MKHGSSTEKKEKQEQKRTEQTEKIGAEEKVSFLCSLCFLLFIFLSIGLCFRIESVFDPWLFLPLGLRFGLEERCRQALQYFVHDAILHCFLRRHKFVPIGVLLDPLQSLASVLEFMYK